MGHSLDNISPTDWKSLTVVGTLLVGHAALLAWGSAVHSPTRDEVGHLPAGISHWHLATFDLYRVNPPLARMVAATPVVLVGPSTDWADSATDPAARADFRIGRRFFEANGQSAFWYMTLARWACILFSLIGAVVSWLWATRLYGRGSGLLALAMWCICPNVIAHGQMITPDIAATSLGAAAAYGFWLWLRAPSWPRAALAGALLGLAELTKTTWIILFLLWPALWVLWNLSAPQTLSRSDWLRRFRQLAVLLLVAVYLLNLGYFFEGSFTPLGNYHFLSSPLTGNEPAQVPSHEKQNRFSGSWLGALPIPAPRNYLQGIDYQKWRFERPDWSYLRGQWRSTGWYYYYVYAMLIKIPLGTWLVGMAALLTAILPRRWMGGPGSAPPAGPAEAAGPTQTTWRDEVLLIAPAAAVLLLVSSHTGFNRHLRYVLPAFPFLFIWASRIGQYADFDWLLRLPGAIGNAVWRMAIRTNVAPVTAAESRASVRSRGVWLARATAATVAGALAWSAVSSLSDYPNSLSYFNELVGGPRGGHWHLTSSNVDWGEDLFFIKDWYDQHPEARPFHFNYRLPEIDPKLVGIESERVPPGPVMNRPHAPTTANWPWPVNDSDPPSPNDPTVGAIEGPQPGWYAMGVTSIHERDGRYEYFLEFEPVAIIGNSTNIYYITRADANRLRRRLGLKEIQPATDDDKP